MSERMDQNGSPDLEQAVRELRKGLPRPPGAVDAIMSACAEAAPRAGGLERLWAWFSSPQFAVSPLAATAAAVVVAVSLIGLRGYSGTAGADSGEPGVVRHQFVLVAPTATEVAVVGDFNDWDPGRTPLTRAGDEGVWVGEVELHAGRHLYSFIVDGDEWVPDEGAPRAPDDEFGRPSSVLLTEAAP